MTTYLECWKRVAASLFAQAIAGQPELTETAEKAPAADSFGFVATLDGETTGDFGVTLNASVLDSPLLGEGTDQKESWGELLREAAEAAAAELLSTTGQHCRIAAFQPASPGGPVSAAFQLRTGAKAWTILVQDRVAACQDPAPPAQTELDGIAEGPAHDSKESPALGPGLELLLDVELEATLRFGCREMPLGELIDLGPGDVVPLDRNVTDPVDLIVSDKIVARGEVVLVDGNFGLRVTEVAEPRKQLESVRCLF